MKRARITVLVIAVAAAGGAAMLAKSMVSMKGPRIVVEKTADTEKVLVANSKIGLGDTVRSASIRWQEWPKGATTSDYVTQANSPNAVEQFSGSLARAPFLPGEPIKHQKLIKASDGGVLAAILPSGMRAISTPIREETAAGGFILPNDRVDVIVTRSTGEKSNGNLSHVSDTVLKNVRVLAIGQNIETKDGNKVVSGKTATLELSPRQAELISLARSMGEISLSLRSLADMRFSVDQGPAVSPFGPTSGNSIKVLKYGVSSQVLGIN